MCGGYEIDADPEALISAFRVQAFPPDFEAEFGSLGHEHFPRMRGPIVLTRKPTLEHPESTRWLGLARWGLVPHWATSLSEGDKLFNARAETLDEKPAFHKAFRSRRCVVPVNSFYEWRKEGKRSQRFRFRASAGGFVALAGLWSSFRAPSGERVGTYTVITVEPNALVAPIHDRMPAVLGSPLVIARWLSHETPPEALKALLTPAAPELLEAAPG